MQVTSASRALLVLGASLVVSSIVAVVSLGASSSRATALPLRAFTRAAVASDALPYRPYASFVGRVLRSRRIATYTDRQGRSTNLFVYEAKGRFGRGTAKEQVWFCTLSVSQGAGGAGGCAPIQVASSKFATHPLDADWGAIPYDGEYVWGVAANNVQRVVLQSKGVRHKIALSADNGFIYNCGANGCAGSINSYGQRGQLLSALRVRPLP